MTTTGTDSRRLRLGTRGSRLALTQSGQVAEALIASGGGGAATAAGKASEGSGGLSIDLVTVRTDGDGDRTPLRQLGGVGVFAARLRHALLDGEVDLVVHSFKDLPTHPVEGLEVTGAWVAGTGIAAVVELARAAAGRLVGSDGR